MLCNLFYQIKDKLYLNSSLYSAVCKVHGSPQQDSIAFFRDVKRKATVFLIFSQGAWPNPCFMDFSNLIPTDEHILTLETHSGPLSHCIGYTLTT